MALSRLTHSIDRLRCGSAMFLCQALETRPAQQTLIVCAGLHNTKNSKASSVYTHIQTFFLNKECWQFSSCFSRDKVNASNVHGNQSSKRIVFKPDAIRNYIWNEYRFFINKATKLNTIFGIGLVSKESSRDPLISKPDVLLLCSSRKCRVRIPSSRIGDNLECYVWQQQQQKAAKCAHHVSASVERTKEKDGPGSTVAKCDNMSELEWHPSELSTLVFSIVRRKVPVITYGRFWCSRRRHLECCFLKQHLTTRI
jgi:hypothetical protein